MPLIQILEKSPDIVLQYNIKQIVTAAGNGVLLDNSECCKELRHYLANIHMEKLFEHANYCLANSFEKSGQVLQDIVNEMGRRLDYSVENGLYQGKQNQIGYDGIWKSLDNNSIVIEIKTTDTYRINLDKIAEYRNKLIDADKITKQSSILVVVGRNDTGDLEAQIRGSKHAWDIRVISVEALIKLVEVKIKSDEDETTKQIQNLLQPIEYTRLDNIIDIIFTAAKDIEAADETGEVPEENREERNKNNTPREILDSVRNRIIAAISKKEKATLIAHKRVQYGSSDKKVRVVCPVSKQYNGEGYWFAYHPRYNIFLQEAKQGYFALGCIGQNFGYAIPHSVMIKLLNSMNVTPRGEKTYWHVHLDPNGKNGFDLSLKRGEKFNLDNYKINIS